MAAGILLLASAPAGTAAPAFDPAQSDPQAIAIADLVLAALGGQPAWDATRHLRFSFVVEKGGKTLASRAHLWDRDTGRLRYDKDDPPGTPVVVLLDVGSRQGEAWRGGARLEGKPAADLLGEAYEAWINDTYWLLMPYKMKDGGVHLKVAGSETRGGATYDLVELTFDQVGLTPKDRYWAHVNRATHLVDRWSYILQDDPPGSKPTVWDWKGWSRRGRVLFSPEKVKVGTDGVRILHPLLEVYDTLPDRWYAGHQPLPARLGP